MNVATKHVTGRGDLRFESLDDVLRDAESLVAAEAVETKGNWTIGQILMHLAQAMDGSIDGVDFQPSWPIRIVGRIIRNRVLRGPMPSGFQLKGSAASALVPASDVSADDALEALRIAIQRQAATEERKPHGVFGALSRSQWAQLHLRHAEMHLSFAAIQNV